MEKKSKSKVNQNKFPTVLPVSDRGVMAVHLLSIPLSQWFPIGFLGLEALVGIPINSSYNRCLV